MCPKTVKLKMSQKVVGFVLFYCLIFNSIKGQVISPSTFNNGGGAADIYEWSIGESVSIAHFSVPGFFLNTGVLQSFTNIVTPVNEYGPTVFENDIIIG